MTAPLEPQAFAAPLREPLDAKRRRGGEGWHRGATRPTRSAASASDEATDLARDARGHCFDGIERAIDVARRLH